MFLQKEETLIFYLDWDWKSSPKWNDLLHAIKIINTAGYEPMIYEMNTNSDEEAVIICGNNVTFDEAENIFKNYPIYFGLENE